MTLSEAELLAANDQEGEGSEEYNVLNRKGTVKMKTLRQEIHTQ